MNLLPVEETAEISLINKLKTKTIYRFSWKKIANTIVKSLIVLVNNCFDKEIFSGFLNNNEKFYLFKKENPSLTTSYRPVSILPVISKIKFVISGF